MQKVKYLLIVEINSFNLTDGIKVSFLKLWYKIVITAKIKSKK